MSACHARDWCKRQVGRARVVYTLDGTRWSFPVCDHHARPWFFVHIPTRVTILPRPEKTAQR